MKEKLLLTPGEMAPEFELADVHGSLVSLSQFRGRNPVVLALLRGFL